MSLTNSFAYIAVLAFSTIALSTITACGDDDTRVMDAATPRGDMGPSSGLSPTAPVATLSPSDLNVLCTYVAMVSAGPEVLCDGGVISGPTVDECERSFTGLPPGCGPTVDVVETCFEAFGVDACGFLANPPAVCAGPPDPDCSL